MADAPALPVSPTLPPLADDQVERLVGAALAATEPADGPTSGQRMVASAVARLMTATNIDIDRCPRIGPDELAALADEANFDESFRRAFVRYESLLALLLAPVPDEVVERVYRNAAALGVGELCAQVMQRASEGSYQGAVTDFARNGYSTEFLEHGHSSVLHSDSDIGSDGWKVVDDDPVLAGRWDDLGSLPQGTLGREVHDFYQSRAFVNPGRPDSAPPLLAQHDWVHVLADIGTRVECEIEVFALIAESDDDPRGFSLLAMVLGLFDTGVVPTAAGLFEADGGHLNTPEMATRLADALRRGMVATRPDGSRDGGLMASDWFAVADLPIEEARRRCNIGPKSEAALAAGSPGVWQLAGLSEYQRAHCDVTVLAEHAAEEPI